MPTIGGGTSSNTLGSLSSIDQWIRVLNSSVSGSATTGFKQQEITFGGGVTELRVAPQGGRLGIQFSEQTLNVGGTTTDFTEGQVVASTQPTHLAINGNEKAFFVLSDQQDSTNANAKFYVSRAGEYHLDANGYMRSVEGLYVIGNMNGTTNSIRFFTGASSATQVGYNGRSVEDTMADTADNHNSNAGADSFLHTIVQDLQSLKFSKYGSHIWEAPTGFNFTVDTLGADPASQESSRVKVTSASLEASNVELPSKLVELSLAQKIYSALTKVITIEQQKLDSLLQTIR